MKKLGILPGLVLLVLTAACNKELIENENAGNSINVTISSASDLTKTSISQDSEDPSLYIPSWQGTEKMGIWIDRVPTSADASQTAPEYLNNTEAGRIAVFKGSLTIDAGVHTMYGFATTSDKYYNRYYKDGVGFEIPQIQNPTLDSFDSDADLLIAKPRTVEIADGQTELSVNEVQFARALAVLKVVLKDGSSKGLKDIAVVKSLTLTPSDVNAEPLTGRANIDVTSGSSIKEFNTRSNVRAEYADDSFVINDVNGAWLLVNPLVFAESSTLTLEVDAGKYTVAKTLNVGGMELKQGDVTIFNVTLKDEDITVLESGLALPFVEDFSEASGGDMSDNSTPKWESSTNFDITGNVYQIDGGIRFGTSSVAGTITTKIALDLSQPFTVIVSGTGWSSKERTLEITAGSQSRTITFTTDRTGGKFEHQYVYFDAETDLTKVAFSARRAFLDQIEIVSGNQLPAAVLSSVMSMEASVNETGAFLNGSYDVYFLGDSDNVTCGFEWGTDASDLVSIDASNVADGSFSTELTGLTTGTTYIFRAWARLNDGEKIYGNDMTFVPAAQAYYRKVSSVTAGKSYLIIAEVEGKYLVAKPITSNYGYIYVDEVNAVDGDIIYSTGAASDENSYVISESDGSYTICQSDGRYLYQQESHDSFNVSATPTSGQYWSIEFQPDGTAKITNHDVNKYVQYSSQYSSFGSYADSRGVMPYLFEKTE